MSILRRKAKTREQSKEETAEYQSLEDEARAQGQYVELALDIIDPDPDQPRETTDDDIDELKQSIEQEGVLQPIVVRPTGDRYTIIFGERRYLASKGLGRSNIPAIVRSDIENDDRILTLQLIENSQRKDVAPSEQAKAVQRLVRMCDGNKGEAARRIGKQPGYISNMLRIANSKTVQEFEKKGITSDSQVLAGLAKLEGLSPTKSRNLIRKFETGEISEGFRDYVEKAVRDAHKTREKSPKRTLRNTGERTPRKPRIPKVLTVSDVRQCEHDEVGSYLELDTEGRTFCFSPDLLDKLLKISMGGAKATGAEAHEPDANPR